jgi:CHASE2 domain-containing sensor protein/tRNA A-37 threonylcarbamoyl transferase component Bud32
MAKRAFWKSDWFSGLIITIVFMFFSGSAAIQGIERWAYDIGVASSDRTPADNIAIIAIDDISIANLGRWPWSRDIHAQMLSALNDAGARVIAPTILFTEAQQDAGAEYVKAIQSFYAQSSLGSVALEDTVSLKSQMDDLNNNLAALPAKDKQAPIYVKLQDLAKFYGQSSLKDRLAEDIQKLGLYLQEAGQALNQDKLLAQSISTAGNVILPMLFELGAPQGNPDQPLPEYVTANVIRNLADNIGAAELGEFPVPALAAFYPIPELGTQVSGIAHLNQLLDVDGGIRKEPLVVDYFGDYYPSFSLMVAAKSLNLKPEDIQVRLGEGVSLKNLNISTDPSLQMNTFFYSDREDGSPAFVTDSFFDVATGKIPVSKYKNKIVLIGQTAAGISTPQKTPVDEAMHPVLTLAHSVSSILQEDFFVTPSWGYLVKLLAVLFVAIYLIVLLPRLSASLAAGITALLVLTLFITEFYLMVSGATWLPLMVPLMLLIVGHGLLTTKRFLWTERSKVAVEMDSSETNRMLGIAFQGQGQLDQAFDKFRKCTLDDNVMDNLYNLALDYERKRQFNKAGYVYRYMSEYDANFRDVQDRMSRAQQMENTMVIGGGGAGPGATMILDGAEKPMLGRYQVEKELGKGAMGMVYLGRDPKINRVVAIKTMALSQEFEEDELEEVKERFFREAESAGRLSHPNIVTIYDAGDEQDLAYIAMELLQGDDLTAYINRDKLLPVPITVKVIADTAEALGYAHAQSIVHRDIKPANIMYEPDKHIVKVTDFGIARITDSSKTKTGVVLGTPSYMSPEQLSGKHVDGRSDLFSLGVTLFQLLTGELPFKADSLATLMFKITNDKPTDITLLRPELPECLVNIVNRCLEKSPDERYQTGAELKADINACIPAIKFQYVNQ